RRGRAFAAGNDRAGVTHALARGRTGAGDERDDGFLHVFLDEFGGFLFGAAADFADHDDALRLFIILEQSQAIDEVQTIDRIATDADAGALAEAHVGGLEHGFVGERARARNDTDLARLVNVSRHDADLAFTRSDDARAVRTDQHGVWVSLQG